MTRRNDIYKMTVLETSILDVIVDIEDMPTDTRLANALSLLKQAQDSVADYVDEVQFNHPKSDADDSDMDVNNEMLGLVRSICEAAVPSTASIPFLDDVVRTTLQSVAVRNREKESELRKGWQETLERAEKAERERDDLKVRFERELDRTIPLLEERNKLHVLVDGFLVRGRRYFMENWPALRPHIEAYDKTRDPSEMADAAVRGV